MQAEGAEFPFLDLETLLLWDRADLVRSSGVSPMKEDLGEDSRETQGANQGKLFP